MPATTNVTTEKTLIGFKVIEVQCKLSAPVGILVLARLDYSDGSIKDETFGEVDVISDDGSIVSSAGTDTYAQYNSTQFLYEFVAQKLGASINYSPEGDPT